MKKCYIISFDLLPNRNYVSLTDRIKEYGTWAKITESTWSVVTDKKPAEIRASLIPFLNDEDKIFIMLSGGRAAWRNVIASFEWLQKHLPSN